MGRLKRVQPGEPFKPSAKTQNAFCRATEYVEQLWHHQRVRLARSGFGMNVASVKNVSGVTRNQFDVLGIDDVFPTPTDNLNGFKAGPLFEGDTPDISDHWGKFAVLLEPALDDAIVPAVLGGICVAKVNVGTGDEALEQADVKDGDAGSLEAVAGGSATIIWKESGTGVKWAIVHLGGGAGGMVSQTVVTDFRVDGTNNKLQVKTRAIMVIPDGDESDWTDVHTGTECT